MSGARGADTVSVLCCTTVENLRGYAELAQVRRTWCLEVLSRFCGAGMCCITTRERSAGDPTWISLYQVEAKVCCAQA